VKSRRENFPPTKNFWIKRVVNPVLRRCWLYRLNCSIRLSLVTTKLLLYIIVYSVEEIRPLLSELKEF